MKLLRELNEAAVIDTNSVSKALFDIKYNNHNSTAGDDVDKKTLQQIVSFLRNGDIENAIGEVTANISDNDGGENSEIDNISDALKDEFLHLMGK